MVERNESRRGRRVRVVLPAALVVGNEQFLTQTENVSLLGTFVQAEREVPIGTPVQTTLNLPGGEKGSGGSVQCQGIVVRTETLRPGLYGLALFFNQFSGDGEERLGRLIEELLEKQNEEAKRYFEERERLRKERMKQRLEEKRKKRRKRGRPRKKRRKKPSREVS